MKIYGLKDLEYYRLQVGDVVIFHVKDNHGKFVDLKYEVHSDFLMCIYDISDASPSDRHFNDEIFTILGLDPHEYCSKYYGYVARDGIWPSYKDYDLEAATNVVKALYTLIDTMNGEWLRVKGDLCTIKSDLCTNIIWNGKEFGYNDTDGGWIRINVDSSYYSNPGTSNCYTTSADSTSLVLIDRCTSSCRNPHQESLIDMPVDKLKKISSQIKTIKEDNNSKLKRI
jgi:hypothetical protein